MRRRNLEMRGKIKKTALIIAGGDVDGHDDLIPKLAKDAFVIAADRGVDALLKCTLSPDLLVGDMDSASSDWRKLSCEKILLSVKKDETDTEMAVRMAIKRGYEKIVLVGGTGSRFDHTLGNIAVLTGAFKNGIEVSMEGVQGSFYWVDKERPLEIISEINMGVSLIPLEKEVTGVRTKGLLYSLKGETLYGNASRGISNEWDEETAKISLEMGILMVATYRKE